MLERLNQALAYVEEHLDGTVDAAALARIAATSEYHLRRMFSALAGMPLSEYVRRRRLTVAGAEVLAGRATLLEIAVRYGYGSGEAFARAFRAVHGVGPGEARRTGAALVSQPRLSFRLTVEGSGSMRYRVVERPEFLVVGFRARVPLVHAGHNAAIADFLRGLDAAALARLEELADQEPRGAVSVCDGLDPSRAEGTELDFYRGVITSPGAAGAADVPEGTAVLGVPAGTWAVFTTGGPVPSAVQNLWRDVFTEWFPSMPYRSRPGPEILDIRLSPDKAEAEAELWLPVEREEQRG
ncbi:AraC family transcriptional regulator [Streptomyces huiliensis]|uniref:AraC family transcriptional regulator n=1 Tax=Streptomyces huiliensis TaxID=2876027 RepID=UPI001CC0D810|nr:AraC family transcriptional regulator [Streptomyces huiliensis]MBZ4321322.1 AraC family transcriptional regulator [Streptomyces huiliensis]